MLTELKNAFKDVFSSKIRGLILLSVLSAIGAFVLLLTGFSYAMSFLPLTDMPKVQKAVEILGYVLFFIMSLMLFPSIVTLVAGFFIDSVTERMAAKDGVRTLRTVPLSEGLIFSGVVAVKGIVASMILIPAGFVLSWIPFVNFLPVAAYYLVNGRLLAREYFFAVALRYTEKQKAEDLFNRYRLYWLKAGIVIAVLMTLPVVNAVSPLVAAAFMQRLFLIKFPDRESV